MFDLYGRSSAEVPRQLQAALENQDLHECV
jgi:hypothetical protein